MVNVYYTTEGIAELFNVSMAAVRRAIKEGRIKPVGKLGKNLLIPDDDTGLLAYKAKIEDPTQEEVAQLKREVANLSKRVKQAEAAQRRAERAELKALRQQARTAQAIAGTQAALTAVVAKQIEATTVTDIHAEVVD